MTEKQWTYEERKLLRSLQDRLDAEQGSAQERHAEALATLAVDMGMPSAQRAGFAALAKAWGFAGNASQFAQAVDKALGRERVKRASGKIDVGALATTLASLDGQASPSAPLIQTPPTPEQEQALRNMNKLNIRPEMVER